MIQVDVDEQDVLSQLRDEDLIAELEDRGLGANVSTKKPELSRVLSCLMLLWEKGQLTLSDERELEAFVGGYLPYAVALK